MQIPYVVSIFSLESVVVRDNKLVFSGCLWVFCARFTIGES